MLGGSFPLATYTLRSFPMQMPLFPFFSPNAVLICPYCLILVHRVTVLFRTLASWPSKTQTQIQNKKYKLQASFQHSQTASAWYMVHAYGAGHLSYIFQLSPLRAPLHYTIFTAAVAISPSTMLMLRSSRSSSRLALSVSPF